MNSIYLIENGKKAGPFTVWQLRDKVRGGDVTRDTLAWEPGMAEWAPMGEIGSVRFEFERAEELSAGAGEKKAERAADVPAVELTDAAREAGVTVNPRDAKGITLPTPKPWRRFWARNFDICLLGLSALIIGVLSGAVTKFEVWGLLGSLKLNLILPLAWVFLEASLLMLIGTTPGKFLLGVRIQTIGGAQKLNLRQALARSMGVWWRGWGLGFPFVMLLSLAFSHYNLKTTRTTPWDAQQGTIVSYEAIKPWRILALAFLVVGLSQFLVSLAGPPPEAFWPARGASAS